MHIMPTAPVRPADIGPVTAPQAAANGGRLRASLARRFADLYFTPGAQLARQDRALVDDMLARLYVTLDMPDRERLARRLAELSDLPPQLMRCVARDELPIARLVLERAGALEDCEIIAIVKTCPPEHHMAIARRAQISPALGDALVGYARLDVLETLLRNRGAVLSRPAFLLLAELSEQEPALAAPLLARTDLPVDIAYDMFWWVDRALRLEILLRFSVERRQLAAAVSDLVPPGDESDETLETVFALLGLDGRADAASVRTLVAQVLSDARDESALDALALRAGIKRETLECIILDQGGEALTVLFKALGLARADLPLIESVCAAHWDSEDAAQIMAGLVFLFDSISRDWADVVLHLWDLERTDGLDEIAETINGTESTLPQN